jgi:hypothetical protein
MDKMCWRYERSYLDAFTSWGTCVVRENFDQAFFLGTDTNIQDDILIKQAAFIEDNGFRFQYMYRFILNQIGLSAEAYAYYRILALQQSIDGDLFDPPPAQIRGNLVRVDSEPNEEVVGFFGAFDVFQKEIYIAPDVLVERQPSKLWINQCDVMDSAVSVQPFWWNPPSD